MSTTRHLINRQRRLAGAASRSAGPTAAPPSGDAPTADQDRERTPARDAGRTGGKRAQGRAPAAVKGTPGKACAAVKGTPGRAEPDGETPSRGARAHRAGPPAVLAVLTVLLGGFAAFAADRAADLRDRPAARNTALTDIARTSEVKGQVTTAVEAVFSYNFADAGALDQAAKTHLTGRAVQQHGEMLATVVKEGPKQKLVLTTTVTASGVEQIDKDRARVLVYADQSNTRTATKEETTYAAAMLAVEAVHEDGTWRIAGIDTFGSGS
ncbi:membrane protein [Streptomyces kurssanovii]|nr:membrane protein [Streptomyces kurssanovii]